MHNSSILSCNYAKFSRALFLYEPKFIVKFSNQHQCTFKTGVTVSESIQTEQRLQNPPKKPSVGEENVTSYQNVLSTKGSIKKEKSTVVKNCKKKPTIFAALRQYKRFLILLIFVTVQLKSGNYFEKLNLIDL